MSDEEEGDKKKGRKRVKVPVQPGDTLRTIAERVLGDRSRWRELRDAGITKDDLEVGKPLRIPRRLVSEQFLRKRHATRAMNADPVLQRIRRQSDLDRANIQDDIQRDRGDVLRQIRRTYEAFVLERDRQLRSTGESWENRGLGMSGGRERDVEQTRSLLDAERQEWETGMRTDLGNRTHERKRERRRIKLELKEAERDARIRARERWNDRKAREHAAEEGLV